MSTINKQRFIAGFVFSFFLSIGFVVSHSLAGLSGASSEQLVAKKADSGKKSKLAKMQVRK